MARIGHKLKVKKEWSPNPYIFAAMRRIFRWSSERRKCLEEAKTANGQYWCAGCSAVIDKKECAVDHISPVVDPQCGFSGWDEYAKRLFCPRSGLQTLCKICHSAKSKTENAIRREVRCRKLKTGASAKEIRPLE